MAIFEKFQSVWNGYRERLLLIDHTFSRVIPFLSSVPEGERGLLDRPSLKAEGSTEGISPNRSPEKKRKKKRNR